MSETNKNCVDADGKYLGSFDGVPLPSGAIVVPSAPNHWLDRWIDGAWVGYVHENSYPQQVIIASPNGTPFKVMVDDDGRES